MPKLIIIAKNGEYGDVVKGIVETNYLISSHLAYKIKLAVLQNTNSFIPITDHIKEALENECAKCTETQKNGTRKVIGHLINNEDAYWKELTAKYDPENKFTAKYEKELREIKA